MSMEPLITIYAVSLKIQEWTVHLVTCTRMIDSLVENFIVSITLL
jgi:hypothetical protein